MSRAPQLGKHIARITTARTTVASVATSAQTATMRRASMRLKKNSVMKKSPGLKHRSRQIKMT